MMKNRNQYYSYIKDKISIKELCDKFGIQTTKSGENYVCSCIYHSDPHPSMHIFTKSKNFYCFECERGGDLFAFLGGKLNCSFHESVEWLEENYPELLEKRPAWSREQIRLYNKSGYQTAFETYEIMTSDEKQKFGAFAEKRGYSVDFLQDRGIFFAEGKKLYNAYATSPDKYIEEIEKLKECQLLKVLSRQKGWREVVRYEDFCQKDRIIITLRDENGIIKGFAARSTGDDKPKYLFSRNLKKSNLLYRLDEVKKRLKKTEENQRIYITEGFFDALRLEAGNCLAAAVLGNTLVNKQITLLEEVIGDKNISLRLFLDGDEAGQRGTVASISKIWKSKVLKKCYLDVVVLKSGHKDPDEAGKNPDDVSYEIYSGFEFLMRYYMRQEGTSVSEININESFQNMNVEERISSLHKLERILPDQEWRELFAYYDPVMESGSEQPDSNNADIAYFMIRNFVLGNSVKGVGSSVALPEVHRPEEKNYYYQMQIALQIARTSYDREEICLEQGTWDRIAFGADAFFEYLYNGLKSGEKIAIPLFSMLVPKKLGIQRRKALYCHEELLVQQYVLNELLSSGSDINYEKNVPAVRYRKGVGTYVTGYRYQDISNEPLSFAYQIDMSAVNGTAEIENGMFRPFYDCWKDYIGYIQDGIRKLESETVYRVKLDIQGFYDNLSKYVIRNALYNSVEEALHYDENRFSCFKDDSKDGNLAERVVSWILEELFRTDYYDPQTGEIRRKEDDNQGIPQGPNLSAYVANVSLFSIDQKAAELIRQINAGCEDGKIRVRYARYVDDMIIIASSPENLLMLKRAIAAGLYDLGLSLSPKTEAEDGISKEEAYDWLVEERGGFGVSAGFDLADDSYEALLEEYEEYEVTDRRGALRLLQSNLYTLLYEGMEDSEQSYQQFFEVFFQTKDIRYNDIVRFSEMLIYYAAKSPEEMIKEYENFWKRGVKYSSDESLFHEDGLDMLVLLSGCIKILQRQKKKRNIDSREKWKFVESKIIDEGKEICSRVKADISADNVLGKNRWALGLKMLEFCGLAQIQIDNVQQKPDIKNEYGYRWLWNTVKTGAEVMRLKPDQKYSGQNLMQNFQFCLEAFIKMQSESDYKEIRSQFQQYLSQYGKGTGNVLLNCIRIWFFDTNDDAFNGLDYEIALRVLLNTVPRDFCAKIIDEIEKIKGYLFDRNEVYEFLPVYPGVGYPGIMAVIRAGDVIDRIDRVDFQPETDNVLSDRGWEKDQEEEKCREYYVKHLHGSGYRNLKDFCQKSEPLGQEQQGQEQQGQEQQEQKKLSAVECMKIVCDVYAPLKEEIARANNVVKKQFPDRGLILSPKNVFIENKKDSDLAVNVENTYLVSTSSMPNAVARQNGEDPNDRYILKTVYEDGKEYWISGYLLWDACNMEDVIFREGSDPDKKRDAEMLDFSMRRLYGSSFEKYRDRTGKKRSYQKSTDRAVDLMRKYLESGDSEKELCLQNAKIVNSFIRMKMGRNENEQSDIDLECAVWAKNYLRFGFRELMRLAEEKDGFVGCECPIKRRVPKWYYLLAKCLGLLAEGTDDFSGLKVLTAGLYADAILMHIRMQVLECIYSLDREQRRNFLENADALPLEELGLDTDELLILSGDIVSVYKDLLAGDKYNKNIKKITHLGWLVLLAKLYEIDKRSGFVIYNAEQEIDRSRLQENLKNIVGFMKPEGQKEQEFPFEDMGRFFLVWQKENADKILTDLCDLDAVYGTVVQEKRSEDYRQRLNAKKVNIDTGWETYEEQPYFLTYGKLDKNVSNIEHSIDNEKIFVYTQTVIRKKVVGFSTIAHDFGVWLQKWENSAVSGERNEISNKKHENIVMSEENREKSVISEEAPEERMEEKETAEKEKVCREEKQGAETGVVDKAEESGPSAESTSPDIRDSDISGTHEDNEGWIRQFQRNVWSKRGKNKPFKNADRIALFQFHIDSSYKHPDAERCGEKSEDEINGNRYLSCAEYRRRNLLEPVMEACALFQVDILLLPEYSLRPETVEWMRKRIDEKNYRFSVWAGTFRVPVGYRFDGHGTISDEDLDRAIYWHSAPLPVIMRNEEDVPEIIVKKFKKYPSVALKEDINPAPAFEIFNNFKSIMDAYFESLKKKDSDIINRDRFGDARDHVIELICAELFAVASISNYPSFVMASLNALANYSKIAFQTGDNDKLGNYSGEGVYKKYVEKYLKDLKTFGDYTAIYRSQDGKKIRRPILLVPACTTRAVDYYVFGQGFYLSAGLKTVFCNAVGTGGRGGSCFIGPDSWDDYKANKDKFLMENTIYHGLKPGLYMQSSADKCRGALGRMEQALLICDVYPDLDKGSPNAESMMSAFSLVAHIPVFEDRNYKDSCDGKCHQRKHYQSLSESNLQECRKQIENYCNEYKEGARPSGEKAVTNSSEIVQCMKILGEYYHSEWFIKRAEYYDRYRNLYPQARPEPALTDWLYVKTDYEEFRNNKEKRDCIIQIPEWRNLDNTNE